MEMEISNLGDSPDIKTGSELSRQTCLQMVLFSFEAERIIFLIWSELSIQS